MSLVFIISIIQIDDTGKGNNELRENRRRLLESDITQTVI